jgi:hypothetical protein
VATTGQRLACTSLPLARRSLLLLLLLVPA